MNFSQLSFRQVKEIKLSGFAALILWLLCVLAMNMTALAQETFNRTIVTNLTNKTAVSFEPEASLPTGKTIASGFGNFRQLTRATGENRIIRLLMDETNAVIFGYELTVEQTASNKFRLKFAPLPANFALPIFPGQKASLAGNRRKTVLLTLPETISDQAVEDAEGLTVNLLFHPQLKIRIADIVRVSATRERLEPPVIVPRELTLDDLELAFKNLKINLNDEEYAKGKIARAYSGSLIWFYLPQKGFFLLSLVPREGYDFRRIGTIDNNKIEFSIGDEKYEMISEEPILPVTGTWGLWILHDPKYRPPFLQSVDENDHATAAERPKPKKPSRIKIKNDGSIEVKMPEVKAPDDKSAYEIDPTVSPVKNSPGLLRDIQIGAATKIENILPKN